MSTQSLALKHWSRILRRWPVDRVRPENVSFQKLMTRRLEKHQKTSQSSPPTTTGAAAAPPASVPSSSKVASQKKIEWDEQAELEQANALYALLEDRYAREYPLPGVLRQPASNPTYYDDLVKEMHEAPTRSWLGSLAKRIQGSFRFS